VLATGHSLLTRAERGPAEELAAPGSTTRRPDVVIAVSHLEPIVERAVEADEGRPIVAAISAGSRAGSVIGTPGESEITEIFDASSTSELVRHARCAVHVVAPDDEYEYKLSRAGLGAR
jgi:hypothetical protein